MTLEGLLETGISDVLVFGCGEFGRIAKKVCDRYKINIVGYLSNTVPENGLFEGIRCFAPNELDAEKRRLYVIPCLFNDKTEEAVVAELQGIGYRCFIDKNSIINLYLKKNIKPVGFKVLDSNRIVVNRVNLAITERCSLRCKYCGQFIPYLKDPICFSEDDVIRWIQRLAAVSYYIDNIAIATGEPFTHPSFDNILDKIASINNVKSVHIATNATIMPNDRFFDVIKQHREKIFIEISDYGDLNRCARQLVDRVESAGGNIKMYKVDYTTENGRWDKPHIPTRHERSDKENRDLYVTCNAMMQCPHLRNGKLYKCSFASMGERLGLIPPSDEDVVDFSDDQIPIDVLQRRFVDWILRDDAINACDYCHAGPLESVPMGEQICAEKKDLLMIYE